MVRRVGQIVVGGLETYLEFLVCKGASNSLILYGAERGASCILRCRMIGNCFEKEDVKDAANYFEKEINMYVASF